MKIYTGISRVFCGVYATDHDGKVRLLDPRLDLVRHGPTDFAWGYDGSGPSQHALALLADVYDDQSALGAYQALQVDLGREAPGGPRLGNHRRRNPPDRRSPRRRLMSENSNRATGMPPDARPLTGALAGAAQIVKLVTDQLPSACTHGTAPDHVFERITREARSIIQALKQKTTA